MIEILFFTVFSAKQPSNPPPQPPPDRIEAVLPKELEFVTVKEDKLLKDLEADEQKNPQMRSKTVQIPRAKRQVNRRGNRNH